VLDDHAGIVRSVSWPSLKSELRIFGKLWRVAQESPLGMVIQHEGQLFTIFSVVTHSRATKRRLDADAMRNLRTGPIIDYRFRAENLWDRAILDES